MNQNIKEKMDARLREFRLPRYRDITDVGLFLDQTARLINGCFEPLPEMALTPSMISNYVKQKLVAHPTRKLYGREQIASLLFISVAKTVLSLTDIRRMLDLQRTCCTEEAAYDRFCTELKQALEEIFFHKTPPARNETERSTWEDMLRFTVITAAHRIHLELYMQLAKESV